jgi:hypothetical protein
MLETIVIDVDDECVPPPQIPKKVVVNVNHKFQKIWAMKMPWAKPIFHEVGPISTLIFHVCTKIESKEKNLVVKWDLLINIQVKRRVLMVSGSWIQNVCMLKMKSLMHNCLQPLSSSSCVMVRQGKQMKTCSIYNCF